MKALFINPPHLSGEIYMKEIGRCGRRAVAGELWPQTGLAYLAAIALECGAEAKIVDAMAESIDLTNLLGIIDTFNPDFIIANSTTPTINNDSDVIHRIKSKFPHIIIAMTGTHVSALPEESLKKSGADFVFINEAEETLREILNNIMVKDIFSTIPQKNLRSNFEQIREKIKGIAFLHTGQFIRSDERGFIEALDKLPMPARNLLPNHAYRMPFFDNEPFVTLIPTRGCPWRCIFCRAGKVWGRRIRTRSVENVIYEIEYILSELKIRNIAFMTDSLTLNKKWAMEFLSAILKKGLQFRWVCNSRTDAVDSEMLSLMKKAGCLLISYGIESGDQNILNTAKKSIELKDCLRAIELTRKSKILSMAYFIIGLPGETKETIHKSIDFAIKLNPDYVNFHVATPFPGTEFYDIAERNKWLITKDWNYYEEEGSAVIKTSELSPEDLMKAQKTAMKRFYLRPSKILKEFASIRSVAELKSRLKAGMKIFSTIGKK